MASTSYVLVLTRQHPHMLSRSGSLLLQWCMSLKSSDILVRTIAELSQSFGALKQRLLPMVTAAGIIPSHASKSLTETQPTKTTLVTVTTVEIVTAFTTFTVTTDTSAISMSSSFLPVSSTIIGHCC